MYKIMRVPRNRVLLLLSEKMGGDSPSMSAQALARFQSTQIADSIPELPEEKTFLTALKMSPLIVAQTRDAHATWH